MTSEELYMLRCIELAQKGIGNVAPNPMVGAVLIYNNNVIGEGWHQQYGSAHAEVNCISSVRQSNKKYIPESCLYVNLEPCSHFGKTPPCSDLIIEMKIPEVIIGCTDTSSKVSGKGIEKLKATGVKVKSGVLEKECRRLNKRFLTNQEKKRPYIFLKWAATADGFISKDKGEKTQISGWEETLAIHKMRQEEAAILVGYQTALTDNPQLNNRLWKQGKQPVRILIDYNNTLPCSFHLKDKSQPTLIFNYKEQREDGNLSYRILDNDKNWVEQLIAAIPEISSLIVEGGAKTLQAFIDSGFWDEAHLWQSRKKTFGEGIAAPILKNSKQAYQQDFGEDSLTVFKNESNHFLP